MASPLFAVYVLTVIHTMPVPYGGVGHFETGDSAYLTKERCEETAARLGRIEQSGPPNQYDRFRCDRVFVLE
jgi:hypothetical protein